jgi:hypothetical protein
MRALTIISLSVLVAFSISSATTIHVDWAGGGDYLTIQEGVDAADEGDTVLVAPGTYTGPQNRGIDFGGTNISLVSETGADNTIIDCEDMDQAITFDDGEDSTTVVKGFTVTNGSGGSGGGIRVYHASPVIEDCIFTSNRGSNGAGIWYGYSDTPGAVRNCVFYGNTSRFRGGGLALSHIAPQNETKVTNCVFFDNVAGTEGSHGGGGIHGNGAQATIAGCTVVGNDGGPGAGGIHNSGGYLAVIETVVAFNTQGESMYGADADHCVIFGNAGGDTPSGLPENLYEDPLFCNIDEDNFTLCENSPCLAGNNSWSELIGAYGQGCGECDAPVEAVAWSGIKSLFR